jgi:hypothetical protein
MPDAYPTATAAWNASTSKHRDRQFPKGVWYPIWFSLSNEPAGHVALVAPDGSVFSTSDLSNTPHQHLDISDLMNYYARYGMTLSYLGWTEDVAGYPVISPSGLAAQGTTTPVQEDELSDAQVERILNETRTMLDQYHTATRNNIIAEVSKKIEDSEYEVKVFTHSVDNSNADRVIMDNRAQHQDQ